MSASVYEEVFVRLRQLDREEHVEKLTVKISNGFAKSEYLTSAKPSSNSLYIELTSESDLLFLYSLKLSEPDFHALKLEQRLLVDFNRFPEMVKQLLSQQMALVLQIEEGKEAVLSITEANQFRELTHLSLKLKRGNDEAVKTHLANKLSRYKSATSDLEAEVSCLRSEVDRLRTDKDSSFTELSRLKYDSESAVSAIQASWKTQVAQLKEDHARELRQLHSSETGRLSDEVKERESRMRELERQLEEFRINSVSLENNFRTSQRRVCSLERELEVSREQAKRKDAEAREITGHNFQLEKKVAQLTVEVNSLTSQTQNSSQLEVSLSTSRASVAQFANRIKELESLVEGKEKQVSKLSMKNRELKLMVKETQGALLQQEQVVIGLNREVADQRIKAESSSAEKHNESSRVAVLNEEVSKLKSQLGESQQLLESNSQVISYLNKKLTDREPPTLTSSYVPRITASASQSSFLLNSTAQPTTTGLTTPVLIPEYPNRLSNLLGTKPKNISDGKALLDLSLPQATSLSSVSAATPSRIFSGQVKFTARNAGKNPILK